MSKLETVDDDPSNGPAYRRGKVLRGDDFEFSDSSVSDSLTETQRESTARGANTVDGDEFGADEILEPSHNHQPYGLGGLSKTKKGKILSTPDSAGSEEILFDGDSPMPR